MSDEVPRANAPPGHADPQPEAPLPPDAGVVVPSLPQPASASRSGWSKYLVLAVPALGLAELLAQLSISGGALTEEDWAGVRAPVAELKQPADLVVVAPAWAGPSARLALGDALMPLAHVARPDESAFPRAIEISARGERSPLLAGWKEAERRAVGPFVLRVLENPSPAQVKFDFVEQLVPDRAQVFLQRPGSSEPRESCPYTANARVTSGGLGGTPTFPARRFACPGADWLFMGETVIDDSQEYSARRCIWAHPSSQGQIGVKYRGVPLGKVIRGYGQLPWVLERLWHGAPITLLVRVEGKEIGRFVHQDGEGWKGFEFPVGEFEGRTAEVEFEVLAQNSSNRHFCFQADTR